MNRLQRSLSSKKLQLFVSLPSNDCKLAQAALKEGADGLKVHINVSHGASGNDFGGLHYYRDSFSEIRSMFDGPLGIVPGGSVSAIQKEEISELENLDFDFVSVFAQHMPPFLLESKLASTFATDYKFDFDLLDVAKDFQVSALEASIIPPDQYGLPLSVLDLLRYRMLVSQSGLPVIVPSQRKIVVEDVPGLASCGVSVLLIGAVVTGCELSSLQSAVASFRNAIDRL